MIKEEHAKTGLIDECIITYDADDNALLQIEIASGRTVAHFNLGIKLYLLLKILIVAGYINWHINKHSKVNCALNRVYKIHDVSRVYPLSSEVRLVN